MTEPLVIDDELKRIAGVIQRLIDRQEEDEVEDSRAKGALASIREESPGAASGEVSLDEVGPKQFDPLRVVVDKDLANRLVSDVFREARKDSRLDHLDNEDLYIQIVGNLLTGNFSPTTDPGLTGVGGLATEDQALAVLIQNADERVIAFPRRPTSNLQIRPLLDALRNEGPPYGITEERYRLLTKLDPSPDAETDQLIEDSLDALRAAAPDIISRLASGITDPRDRGAIVRHAEALIASEKKAGVRPGESVFPLLFGDTPQLLQAEADAAKKAAGLGRDKEIGEAFDAAARLVGIGSTRGEFGSDEEFKVHTQARQQAVGDLAITRDLFVEANPGIAPETLRSNMQVLLQRMLGDGQSTETSPFLAIKAQKAFELEASTVSSVAGSNTARDLWLSNNGIPKDSLSEQDLEAISRDIRANGSMDKALGDLILQNIPLMQRLKINEAIGESRSTLEQTVRDAGFPEDQVVGTAQQLGRQLSIDPQLDVDAFLFGPEVDAEGRPIPSYRRGGLLGAGRPPITPGPISLDPDVGGFIGPRGFTDAPGPGIIPRRAERAALLPTSPTALARPETPRLQPLRDVFALDPATREERAEAGGFAPETLPTEGFTGTPPSNEERLAEFRNRALATQTPLTQEQAIELGFPATSGYSDQDLLDIFGYIPQGLTAENMSRIAGTGKFVTVEDAQRRFGPLPPDQAPAGVPRPGEFPSINLQRAPSPSRLIDFGFPDTEAGKQAFSDRLSNMAFLAAEGDTDLQRFFIDEMPKLIPAFQEAGIAGFKEKERRARETATSLQKAGKFSPGQTAAFIGDVGRRREKLDFVPFAEGRLPGLKSKFLETPFAVEREQKRVETAAREAEAEAKRTEAEEEQKKRRRLRRRGRTRITRAV